MSPPSELASTLASSTVLAQTGGSGGSVSLELVAFFVIIAVVAVSVAWLMT